MKFKTIQFDTLVETDLKGIITSINLTLFIWVNLKENSKFDENLDKKKIFWVKSYISSIYMRKINSQG